MYGLLQGVRSPRTRLWAVLALCATASVGCVSTGAVRTHASAAPYVEHDEPELVGNPETRNQEGPVEHRVEAGQTVYRIARTYDISVDALMRANGLTDPRTLAVGQVLVIPGVHQHREIVPPGAQEAPEAVAAQRKGTAGPPAETHAEEEPRAAASPAPKAQRPRGAVQLPQGEGVLAWPLRGVIYARFGRKGSERHDGIDLAAPAGTPVQVARGGTVLYAGEQKGYGWIAIVDHGNGLITLYAHNRDVRVKTGQTVRDGQVVATVGESGRTSGPHLHFEVRKEGLPVDPLKYLGAPPGEEARGRRAPDGR
jgi:murein DD-endopeptidase MepM/ murein hydrolase activator NlpD